MRASSHPRPGRRGRPPTRPPRPPVVPPPRLPSVSPSARHTDHPPAVWVWRWRRRRTPGQALIEFLLVIPILLLLLFGLIDVGQALLANYTVNQAARSAAHVAAIGGGDEAAATQTVRDVISGGVGMSSARAVVRVTCPHTPCRRYDPITVTIDYTDAFWTPVLAASFTVHATATRASERDAQ